jgi:hypothetical protein
MSSLKERTAELRAGGMSQAEALMTAADEGLIDPRQVENMLRVLTPVQALDAASDTPPQAPRPQTPSPTPVTPDPRQRVFPPSGPAPLRPNPDQIQMLAAKGAISPRDLAALHVPLKGQAPQPEGAEGLSPETIMAYAQQRGGLSPYEAELLRKRLGPQMNPAMLAALAGGK